jgi:hypothetical protein
MKTAGGHEFAYLFGTAKPADVRFFSAQNDFFKLFIAGVALVFINGHIFTPSLYITIYTLKIRITG